MLEAGKYRAQKVMGGHLRGTYQDPCDYLPKREKYGELWMIDGLMLKLEEKCQKERKWMIWSCFRRFWREKEAER